jgi:hypothetical protein
MHRVEAHFVSKENFKGSSSGRGVISLPEQAAAPHLAVRNELPEFQHQGVDRWLEARFDDIASTT